SDGAFGAKACRFQRSLRGRDDARHSMASDAAAPNVSNAIRFEENGCIAPGGLAAARPGKGQGYFRTSFIRLTSLSRGFGSIGGPPEHRTVHPHAVPAAPMRSAQ